MTLVKNVIVADGKYGTETYASALGLLSQRLAEGIYYFDEDDGNDRHQWYARAARIVAASSDGGDPDRIERAALGFLNERNDYEYEGISLQVVQP